LRLSKAVLQSSSGPLKHAELTLKSSKEQIFLKKS